MKYINIYSKSIKRVASPFDHPELDGKLYLKEAKKSLDPFFTRFDIHEVYHYEFYSKGFNTKVCSRLYAYAWKCMNGNREWRNGLWAGQFHWIEEPDWICGLKYIGVL